MEYKGISLTIVGWGEISEFSLVLQFVSGNNDLQSIDKECIGRHSLFKKTWATKNVTVFNVSTENY